MERNMDLVRQILLKAERNPEYNAFMEVEVEGFSADQVAYHMRLMDEANLLHASDCSGGGGHVEWRFERLTWEGHEFLDSCRDEGVWEKAKTEMASKAKGMTFAVLSALLIEWAKRAVFQP